MKSKVKRTALSGLYLKVWQCIAGCLLATGTACAYDSYSQDDPIFDQAEAVIIDADDMPVFDESWEPDLTLDDQPPPDPGYPTPTGIAPLIPWDPRITQSILPIDQSSTSHTAANTDNKLQGMQAKILPPSNDQSIALELPQMPAPRQRGTARRKRSPAQRKSPPRLPSLWRQYGRHPAKPDRPKRGQR